ncbi:YcxB family protein [Flavobacterium ustbae]|uniref:YcxB family protein n=1 Tax=Flavobacterium ustbae TaxID=2488790 RepID=UPI0013DDCABF|nr:YcxB family protein [Flavobacterium ustbae]
MFKDRIVTAFFIILVLTIIIDFFNINKGIDFVQWLIRSAILIILFIVIGYALADTICKVIFQLTKKLMKFERFLNKYRFNFTSSEISICSPMGGLIHNWSKIEKVILTKNFLFFYIKERNGYIISVSKKDYEERKIKDLIEFVEKNVTHIIKL